MKWENSMIFVINSNTGFDGYLLFRSASVFLIYFGFGPQIVLKLFLYIEGVATCENQRILLQSLLILNRNIVPNFILSGPPLSSNYVKMSIPQGYKQEAYRNLERVSKTRSKDGK